MLVKMMSKNRITLPKVMTEAVGSPDFYNVDAQVGKIVLTPVRLQRGDAARAKLTEPDVLEEDILEEVNWEGQVSAAKKPRGK